MTSPLRNWIRSDREGQTLAIVAVSMVALLAMMSLGIDLGMAYTARAEAQRVADSAALAGASVFLDIPEPVDPKAAAEARAREYASRNVVRNRPVHPTEDVTVWVLLNEEKVRVRIERRGLPTWFARFIGQDNLTVSAIAAAQAIAQGTTDCLKPWAVVDAFLRKVTNEPPDPDEPYNEADHHYEPATARCGGGTGYGAETLRGDCDFGLEFIIKSNNPNDPAVPTPGLFMPIRLPADKNQGECLQGGGGPYQRNICACNNTAISIGDLVPTEPGNMSGPTLKGVEDLVNQDPDAYWDPEEGMVSELGKGSPRLAKMLLIRPDAIKGSGMDYWEVQGFGQFFIEEFWEEGKGNDKEAYVKGRFMYYMSGTDGGQGTATSPLIKTLRLVE
jgi:hypothetical protein